MSGIDTVDEPDQKISEIVKMEDDRSLSVSIVTVTKGISPGVQMWTSTEADKDYYFDLLKKHGLTKPGQQSVHTRELRNDDWIEKYEREGTNW